MPPEPPFSASSRGLDTRLPGAMLARARALGRRPAECIALARPRLALDFYRTLNAAEQAYARPTHPVWCDSIDAHMPRAATVADLGSALPQPEAALAQVRRDGVSRAACMDPAAALRLQALCDTEVSGELVYDTVSGRVGAFVTRGCRGGVMSDLLFYFWFSPRYVVLPVFHTHPGYLSDLGYKLPSTADYRVMRVVRDRLDGAAAGERVYFADGSWTEYGFTAADRAFFRRQGDAIRVLPPACLHAF
ncbi:MAG: hypothetical protein K9L70_00730 [Thiohalocapsa sp.]|nr:hypothetical protein [Thiohalocapsa sp.]MCF7989282.1 hypothetical protein [Thiohalocapsa sp.]